MEAATSGDSFRERRTKSWRREHEETCTRRLNCHGNGQKASASDHVNIKEAPQDGTKLIFKTLMSGEEIQHDVINVTFEDKLWKSSSGMIEKRSMKNEHVVDETTCDEDLLSSLAKVEDVDDACSHLIKNVPSLTGDNSHASTLSTPSGFRFSSSDKEIDRNVEKNDCDVIEEETVGGMNNSSKSASKRLNSENVMLKSKCSPELCPSSGFTFAHTDQVVLDNRLCLKAEPRNEDDRNYSQTVKENVPAIEKAKKCVGDRTAILGQKNNEGCMRNKNESDLRGRGARRDSTNDNILKDSKRCASNVSAFEAPVDTCSPDNLCQNSGDKDSVLNILKEISKNAIGDTQSISFEAYLNSEMYSAGVCNDSLGFTVGPNGKVQVVTPKKKINIEERLQGHENDPDYHQKFQLISHVVETEQRIAVKDVLRSINSNIAGQRPDDHFFTKLDSSLKKNTAFVRKLKTFTGNQLENLLKEFLSLNLTKYVSEVAAALVEAKLKMVDVWPAVQLCNVFHGTYAEFSVHLLDNWHKVLTLKKDEKIANAAKLRVDIRFYAELVNVGIFTHKEGLPLMGNILTVLTHSDREDHLNINIILSFCRHCGDEYAGLIPRKMRELYEKYGISLPKYKLLPKEKQRNVKALLKDYFNTMCKHMLKEHLELQSFVRQNRKILQTKGELSSERKEKLEILQASFERIANGSQQFAEALDEDLPSLPEDESLRNDTLVLNGSSESEEGTLTASLWEDDETRRFYECLPDMKEFMPSLQVRVADPEPVRLHPILSPVPFQVQPHALQPSRLPNPLIPQASPHPRFTLPILHHMNQCFFLVPSPVPFQVQPHAPQPSRLPNTLIPQLSPHSRFMLPAVYLINQISEETLDAEFEEIPPDGPEEVVSILEMEESEDTEPVGNLSNKILLDSFLTALPNCINREMIDSAAVDFVMTLNTKHNRRKLVKTLFNVPRIRLDLLPFYARLVATLHPVMPDVATDLAQMLKQDFKYHVRKKDQMNIESKIKIVRFIGELVKFRMYSKIEGLYCVKVLVQDFTHHHIEMCCNLLESCGRFFFRHPDCHQRMKVYLDQMMRKKAVMALDSRYVTMIENAYYYVNPPESAQCVAKERPVEHQFIRKILYQMLMKSNTDKVLRLMRKLDWSDPETHAYAVKCLTYAFKVKYFNIRCLASLLAGLVTHQEGVGAQVVDGVMEDIRLGMELNLPKYNQRRVAMIKYLGELYNYRMVESSNIFQVLYSLITFGVTWSHDIPSPLDPPDNLFRVRLVCVLLETCGQYFISGMSKKKLDIFLVYFQHYFWFKYSDPIYTSENPFPVGINYMFKDTITSLRPNIHLFSSYAEATEAVTKLRMEETNSLFPQGEFSSSEVKEDEITEELEVPETLAQNSTGLNKIEAGEEETNGDEGEAEDEEEGEEDKGSASQKDRDEEEEQVEDEDDEEEEEEDDDLTEPLSGEIDDTEVDWTVNCDTAETASHHSEGDSQSQELGLPTDPDIITQGPKLLECPEDEDFLTAFDRMVSDNIQDRMRESVKPQQVDISVPLHIKGSAKKTYDQLQEEESTKLSVNFILMLRKGHKQQYRSLEVPVNSEMALNLKNREEAERAEKERVKRLTLDINERLEEEDYQEMLAQAQRPVVMNLNRERRHKYQHPKGAPDADLIFGPKKVR